jgi:hypothetical protein
VPTGSGLAPLQCPQDPVWHHYSAHRIQFGTTTVPTGSSLAPLQCPQDPVWHHYSAHRIQFGTTTVSTGSSLAPLQCPQDPVWHHYCAHRIQFGFRVFSELSLTRRETFIVCKRDFRILATHFISLLPWNYMHKNHNGVFA